MLSISRAVAFSQAPPEEAHGSREATSSALSKSKEAEINLDE
ncbi:hypothetical protein [Calothrix sp. UHCC 0171]|nr:hypothetical protein [Calothrix sp. UHCC 0171]MEA5573134.1 hypothetical protein [Calothrix sp. UHCC 0171]